MTTMVGLGCSIGPERAIAGFTGLSGLGVADKRARDGSGKEPGQPHPPYRRRTRTSFAILIFGRTWKRDHPEVAAFPARFQSTGVPDYLDAIGAVFVS